MSERIELSNRLCNINADVSPDDVIVAFSYNLKPDDSYDPTEGFVAVTSSRVYVYENDTLISDYDASLITEYILTSGVGCVFAECICDGVHVLLCRGDMTHKDAYASIIRQLNHKLENGKYSYAYEEDIDVKCPKCVEKDENGYNLGSWISTQRQAKKDQKGLIITPEQIANLNCLVIVWY